MLYRGQKITVVNKDRVTQYVGTVDKISRTRKVVVIIEDALVGRGIFNPTGALDVTRATKHRFYRDDRQGSDKQTYIDSPGSGTFGHILNDRFVEPPRATKVVRNLISGSEVTIDEDTPGCCDPSTERYWSM